MRNIKDMQIILIDITNLCNKSCSNCTRFCGHHSKEKIYFMDVDYFEKAVKTLSDYHGVIGIMGGEPTLHPQFVEICDIFTKTIPNKSKRGLWTNMSTQQYHDYGNVINNTFGYFATNNHVDIPIMHTPMLVASEDFKNVKDMGTIINNCWVQNTWSATITPKGAYFCEVCATLSMLFDGPNGWDVEKEPDWWKKELLEYQKWIDWGCTKCGAALPLKPRRSNEVIDDISISNLKRLQNVKSPKIAKNKYKLHKCSESLLDRSEIRGCAWYREYNK